EPRDRATHQATREPASSPRSRPAARASARQDPHRRERRRARLRGAPPLPRPRGSILPRSSAEAASDDGRDSRAALRRTIAARLTEQEPAKRFRRGTRPPNGAHSLWKELAHAETGPSAELPPFLVRTLRQAPRVEPFRAPERARRPLAPL